MREVFYTDDTPANRISYYFLLVFLVTLPFDRFYSELALIGLTAHTLLHPVRGRVFSWYWPGWLLLSLYLLTMIGTIRSGFSADALGEWEKQLALLLFPLIAWFSQADWQVFRERLLTAFSVTCLLTILYLYGVACWNVLAFHHPISFLFSPPFMNHAFSAPIALHATYLSMYCGIAIVVFLQRGLDGRARRRRWGNLIAAALLLMGILQLASRAVCIAVLLLINILPPYFMLMRRKAGRMSLLFSGTITVLMVGSLFIIPAFHQRYLMELQQDLTHTIPKEGSDPRMARWDCAWELIRASPLIGYGTGTETTLLQKKYYEHRLFHSYTYALNAHDQYISFLLQTGLAGLAGYLLLIGVGFVQAIRCRDPVFMAALVMIVLVSFSENILSVNKGIFFVSSFFCLFFSAPETGAGGYRTAGVLKSDSSPSRLMIKRFIFSRLYFWHRVGGTRR